MLMNVIHAYASQFIWIIPMTKIFISRFENWLYKACILDLLERETRILVIFDFFGIFWELTILSNLIKVILIFSVPTGLLDLTPLLCKDRLPPYFCPPKATYPPKFEPLLAIFWLNVQYRMMVIINN